MDDSSKSYWECPECGSKTVVMCYSPGRDTYSGYCPRCKTSWLEGEDTDYIPREV